jgi:hypothetical protein
LALTGWHGFGILGKRRIVERRIEIVRHGDAAMDARTRFSTRFVGGLPVVAAYLGEVGIARLVEDMVPCEGDAHGMTCRNTKTYPEGGSAERILRHLPVRSRIIGDRYFAGDRPEGQGPIRWSASESDALVCP